MSLARLAVDRPISTLMVSIATALLGAVALTRLSVDLMPDMEFPTVTVTTLYPGAGPEEVETLITRPLEQVMSSVNGFDRLTATSLEGSSNLRVQFNWGTNLDVAVDEMRQAIDKVRANLPVDVDPPLLRRYDANDQPILYLGLNSERPVTELTTMAEKAIVPRLERLDGVARIGMRGGIRREIQVEVDRAKLESLGLGINEVVASLQQANISRPAGDYQDGNVHRLIRSRSEFQSLDEIRNLVVRRTGDAAIRIRDIADVVDGHERITQRTRTNGEPGIMLYVFKQAGANTIDVSNAVHREVAALNRELRRASLVVRMDKSNFIRGAISNLRESAIFGMALAMLVLIVFLRSFRSTFIIGVSMPLSILATLILVYWQGYTLNMVSFGGLALGLGMLVDNSIVVLESIFRRREDGDDPRTAAITGTEEVAGAIVASTVTTLIVFLPLMFVHGMTGILLHQMAFVVSISLLCSLFVSMTLTPALAAYWLGRAHHAPRPGWFGVVTGPTRWLHRITDRIFSGFEQGYSTALAGCLKFPLLSGLALLLLLSVVAGLAPRIGTEFLPKADDGRLGVTITMAPGIQIDTLDRQTRIMEQAVLELVPEMDTMSVFIGDEANESNDWNESRVILQLVPRDQRLATADQVRKRIADQAPPIAGAKVTSRVFGSLPLPRNFNIEGDNIAVLIRGHDRQTAEQLAGVVEAAMKSVPGMVNVQTQVDDKRPELVTRIDRAKASHLGITVEGISRALETTFRGTQATVYREDGDEFNVLVRLREQDRGSRANLDQVGITTPAGKLVPMGNLVSYASEDAPVAIERVDRQRTIVVSGAAEGRDLGSVVGDLQESFASLPVPDGFHIEVSGDWEQQQESFRMLTLGFALAIVLMYMVMAAQFESLTSPLLILTTLPLAAVGVILVLVYWSTSLNVQSGIGMLVLAGVVVNNAIVLVDYAWILRRRETDLPALQIIRRASVRRFRPILMTTLTTVLGMLPVAFGWGEGGELQAPMARVVVGGLISGTLITLWAIPLVLSLVMPEPRTRSTMREPLVDSEQSVRESLLVGAG